MPSKARVVSVAFALSGFAVALVSGLAAGNSASRVLLNALAALIACQLLGVIVGAMIERLIAEQEARYRAANPVPVVPSLMTPVGEGIIDVDEVVEESGTTHAAP